MDVKQTRETVLGKTRDEGQVLAYQTYRLAFRAVGENTNERNMIATILPPLYFCGHSIIVMANVLTKVTYPLYLCGVLDSFVVDYALRMKITRNVSMFHVYQMPLPRLTEKDAAFWPIVKRAARLICTTPEFDDLAKDIFSKCGTGVPPVKNTAKMAVPLWLQYGTTDPVERAKLRAELDGLIAHLYGLTEEEFSYILTTFPLVKDDAKQATLQAYCDVEKGLIK